ncbi:SigE family RNA polymerase sigma factor [Actinokineospora cianjurensis]|uniref:RNA polymerase sigma-70 factor (Sigma-E family) n=1 Tax=Actinokineospora cianjurensis TaxID=585224 RepID=A0A421BAW6_9PSEU|nr:SigE family RNA polymerase sigma factor [Actinokineospora cianjurensis]RLK61519.1 RNA polymerase sigma-70 factor (sigma-E family) [Actinokineospora cianjurensis]
MTFDEYVRDRGQALLRFAYLLTGDRHLAEDLVQTALLKAHGRWRRVAAADHPDAYLRRIMVNANIDWQRKRSNSELPVQPGDAWFEVAGAGDHADHVAARAQTWGALAALPPGQRAVLVLRFYEDRDDRAIAELLGCAESTVRSQASRALSSLRTAWGETMEPAGE